MDEQIATYEAILAEGVKRSKPWDSRQRPGWAWEPRTGIAGCRRDRGKLVVVVIAQRPLGDGGSALSHLPGQASSLRVLVAQTEISDDQFAQLTVAARRRSVRATGRHVRDCRDCSGWDQSIRLIGGWRRCISKPGAPGERMAALHELLSISLEGPRIYPRSRSVDSQLGDANDWRPCLAGACSRLGWRADQRPSGSSVRTNQELLISYSLDL